MTFQHGKPLHLQVAARIRREWLTTPEPGQRLPTDGDLAKRWQVSSRTIREALLLLEAEGRVKRRRGSGTFVQPASDKPLALFSELNLLHARTPRFFGLTLDLVREILAKAGKETRLYTGRSHAGDPPGVFTCPELLTDAEAGRLGGIVAITATLTEPPFAVLRQAGLPIVTVSGQSPLTHCFNPTRIPELVVPYLVQQGRRRIGLIGWDRPAQPEDGSGLVKSFHRVLETHGLTFRPDWCRVDLSSGWGGAGWEEFREIWSAREEKPDALVITDENYLPEVVMALLQLGLRVPADLLMVSHRARFVDWQLPVPVTWIEMDAEAFAGFMAAEALAALRGEPQPEIPTDIIPYRLIPSDLRPDSERATLCSPLQMEN